MSIYEDIRLLVEPVDPVIADIQKGIFESIASGVTADELDSLRGQCAVLGHVKSLIRTANYDTCFFCGIHMP